MHQSSSTPSLFTFKVPYRNKTCNDLKLLDNEFVSYKTINRLYTSVHKNSNNAFFLKTSCETCSLVLISCASMLPGSVNTFIKFTFLDIEININLNIANLRTGNQIDIKSQVHEFIVLIQIANILGCLI